MHGALKKIEINKKSPWLSLTAWAGNSLNCELQDGRYFVCQFQDGRHQCLGITRWPPILFGNFEMAAIIVREFQDGRHYCLRISRWSPLLLIISLIDQDGCQVSGWNPDILKHIF